MNTDASNLKGFENTKYLIWEKFDSFLTETNAILSKTIVEIIILYQHVL